jgi:hypothetical protein
MVCAQMTNVNVEHMKTKSVSCFMACRSQTTCVLDAMADCTDVQQILEQGLVLVPMMHMSSLCQLPEPKVFDQSGKYVTSPSHNTQHNKMA